MSGTSGLRPDLKIIFDHVPPGTKLLDIGCGEGDLLAALRAQRGVDGRGLELDAARVGEAVARGLPVVQGDANIDLADYMSDSFDFAVMSQTLPALQRPAEALDHLMRISRRAFVTFPNFAHWRIRASIALRGQMPVTALLPERWFETPNIHHLSIEDFRELVRDKGYSVEGCWFLSNSKQTSRTFANLTAENAVFLLGRGEQG